MFTELPLLAQWDYQTLGERTGLVKVYFTLEEITRLAKKNALAQTVLRLVYC